MFRAIANTIFLFASAALFLWFIKPGWTEITQLSAEKKSLENALLNVRQIQKLRDERLEKYNSIPSFEKEKINHLLPQAEDEAGLIVMLEELARTRGIFLKNISILEKK